MSKRLRGPPKPRDEMGPGPPDARTFITFTAMMLVIAVVIVGIGGVLHGFPTLSGPAEPQDADAGGDAPDDNGGDADSDGGEGSAADEEDTDPLFDDGDGDPSDENTADERDETDDTGEEQVDVEIEERDGAGFENG